jgi:predicted metal-dependent phosphoesterase TrpH
MKTIDLHIHTSYSADGELSPKEIIDLAKKSGLKFIAITDHNNMKGVREALEYSKGKEITVIPGIEISCEAKEFNTSYIDIVGLFIKDKNKMLNDLLIEIKKGTKPDIRKAIRAIKNAKGIAILAHPGLYFGDIKKIVDKFVEAGGDAIEVYYPYNELYNLNQELLTKKFMKFAKEKNIPLSGGSDFHGPKRKVSFGQYGVSEEEFEKLKNVISS